MCPACLSATNAAVFSLFYSLLLSLSSVLNAVDLRKNRQLILIAISQYAAIVNACPNPILLLRFNALRNQLLVYFYLLGSASHMCDNITSFSYTIASNCC